MHAAIDFFKKVQRGINLEGWNNKEKWFRSFIQSFCLKLNKLFEHVMSPKTWFPNMLCLQKHCFILGIMSEDSPSDCKKQSWIIFKPLQDCLTFVKKILESAFIAWDKVHKESSGKNWVKIWSGFKYLNRKDKLQLLINHKK